jgi:hypothetical protein
LINPLIPSRGLSGGGLAKAHGHLSGGHTVGHFTKGADGKMQFKATDRYASKADWEKAVKSRAAAVGVKQEAVKQAVGKAEAASNQAEKVTSDGHPKAVQAAAHKVAAEAHQNAAKAFQSAGEGPTHKSGVLTHSAHSAIHASKATQMEQAAKSEAAAKLEKRKALAEGLSAKAHNLSTTAKGSQGSPKEKAAAHAEAAEAHKAAQAANKVAGNHYSSDTHGKAVDKHTNISNSQQALHNKLEQAADAQSESAGKATKSAGFAEEEGDSLVSQIAAHKQAGDAHQQAHSLHSSIGNQEKAQHHLTQKMAHNAAAANLKQKKAEQDALQAEHKEATTAADKASVDAGAMGATPDAVKAHKDASKAYMAAKAAALAAGQHDAAQDHHENAVAHLNHAGKIHAAMKAAEEKKAKQAENDKLTAEASQAYNAAYDMPEGTPEEMQAKADAFGAAVKAAGAALQHGGKHDLPTNHLATMKMHQSQDFQKDLEQGVAEHKAKAEAEHAAKIEAQKNQAKLNQAAYDATDKAKELSEAAQAANTVEAHNEALDAHITAAIAAKKADHGPGIQEFHKNQGMVHATAIKKMKEDADAKATADQQLAAKAGKATALSSKAFAATDALFHAKDKTAAHLEAADAHAHAAKAASDAGKTGLAKKHADYEKLHLADAKKSQADADAATKAAGIPKPPVATEPKASGTPLKPVGALKGTGKHLGSHSNEVMKDEAGNEWLNKEDPQGYSRVLDPAVASLHRKVGLATPVFVKYKKGHLQEMIQGSTDAFPDGQFNPEKLSPDDITKMLQYQVLDYATGNQDSHSGQWLQTSRGLQQVDQGQAFKFGVGKGVGGYSKGDPTTTYTPNPPDVPVYPKLWNAAKAGKIQIPDPNGDNAFAHTIKAVQDMPDEQFKTLFKPYAVQALNNGHNPGGHSTVEGFLDDIAKHKNTIGKDFEKLYNGLPESAKAGTPGALSKDDALKKVAEHTAQGDVLKSGAISKAKAAGASLDEIHNVMQEAKAEKAASTAGMSAKDVALKKLAEHEQAGGDMAVGGQLEKAALAAGASVDEIKQAAGHPDDFLKGPGKAAPSGAAPGLSPKLEALKAVAEYAENPPDNWSLKTYQDLKDAAKAAGASPDEMKDAQYSAGSFLKNLPAAAPAPAAPSTSPKDTALKALAEHSKLPDDQWTSEKHQELKKAAKAAGASVEETHKAFNSPGEYLKGITPAGTASPAASATPAKPKADPFKPKAKWTKGSKGLKTSGGDDLKEVQVVEGPKGLVVHKKVGGTGWSVASADGLAMGSKFKTQKEAKLAAEWMAKNYGGDHFTQEKFNDWKTANPEELAKFKQGLVAKQWNKDAQAELDKAAPTAPSATAPAVAAPAGSAKTAALKALAEHNLPENGDHWDYDKDVDLKDAAKAAGASTAEINAAEYKPKTFLKGLSPDAAAAQHITFPGLTNNKYDNAQLLKKLYNQAHGPNATAADKAEYAKAQAAWLSKHSSGPFDPSKVLLPGQVPELGSVKNPQAGGPKQSVKKSGNPGFTPSNPVYSSDKYASTDPEVIAANTKKAFPSSYEAGYRMVPLSQSANGDWKPDDADKGPGTGAYMYSTSSYGPINEQLRGHSKKGIAPIGPTGGKWDNVIAHADSIFEKSPGIASPIVTVRQMGSSGPFPVPPPPLAPGAVFNDPGYGSTSKAPGNWSGHVHMEIRIPTGAKVLDLNHTVGSAHSSEMELLLPRNTHYRVVSDSWSEPGASPTGARRLVVEVVV